jgi:hypothetical protein
VGIPLPFTGEFELTIMIEVVTEEMLDTADFVIALGKVWKRRNRR